MGCMGHWIRIRLKQHGGNTSALEAVVTILCGDRVRNSIVGADGSYLSQSPAELHFGLGEANTIDAITARWPDGQEDVYEMVAADQILEYQHTP